MMLNSTRLSDARLFQRALQSVNTSLDARFEAFKAEQTAAMAAATAQLQALINEVKARPYAVVVGERSITVGALLSVTLAGVKKTTIGAAGVRPTDHAIYLQPKDPPPDGFGFPGAICKTPGFIDVRITTPQIAIGVQQVITFTVVALRTEASP
ncbi:hypothetical protein [Rhizobium sp. 9140]|uniref:hypothetical protein n=1 Tax=Rhizobium sp. 9140 TaxID=1761900 RepID=UPI000792635F|nr:hypothetical protein [Rhizobium sp. 9140]CZT36127.1 hypothetical protein GA0004734_00031290 [Rhizobium sp. 9140]